MRPDSPPVGGQPHPATVSAEVFRFSAFAGQYGRFAATLSAAEQARAARYVAGHAAERFVIRRGLLRERLAARLGIAPIDVPLAGGADSRPVLTAGHDLPDLRISISTSGDHGALAFAIGADIGIDIEETRCLDDAAGLAATAFSHGEVARLLAAAPALRDAVLLRWWTRKEAVMKATGVGAALGFDRVGAGPTTVCPDGFRVAVDGWSGHVRDLDIPGGPIAAMATTGPGAPPVRASRL